MRQIKTLIVLTVLALICACGERMESVVAKTPPAPIEASKPKEAPKPTPEAWKAAVEGLYTQIGLGSNAADDGVTEFMACFGGAVDKKCASKTSSAKRDAFRKLRIFSSSWIGTLYGDKVGSYVSLRDNQQPVIVLVPHLFLKNGPIFMKQVSIMVDGEVTLEQSLSTQDVKLERFPGGVEEQGPFVAAPAQIEALRKINPESKVLIRITGAKAYRTLDKKEVESFKGEVENLLFIYDAIQKAVLGKTIPDPST